MNRGSFQASKTQREVQSEMGKEAEDEKAELVFYSISYHVLLKKVEHVVKYVSRKLGGKDGEDRTRERHCT